ncbi:hypothetical protein Z042_23045 [Chania multitudinisentens RB-25]|uniref:Uncharacterized protein n=1 Tax=Chania multitudinisentens RB-25 TaxID=1441930 RepID=W0LGX9_9GAMM|nr:hypothetical protein [Chania multitudinisentens]AHG22991.1 hypothetical protein Z042_23045 [Chania multitudinisentens RB-25]
MSINGRKFTPEEQQEIADAIERNKEDSLRENNNFGMVFGVVWILTAILLAKTTELGLVISGVIGMTVGWFVASRLK